MDIVTVVIIAVVAVMALGYVQRLRTRGAMRRRWKTDTGLSDPEIEAVVRQALRGLWPGRVRGSVDDGAMERTIRRWAVNASSRATVSVSVDRHAQAPNVRVVAVELTEADAETFLGMVHPFWSAPLAAQRRANAIQRRLLKAEAAANQPAAVCTPGSPGSADPAREVAR